jgi:isochorismate synthase
MNGDSFVTVNRLANEHADDDVIASVRREIAIASSSFDDSHSRSRLDIEELRSGAAWKKTVADAVDTIRNGKLDKVVLARAERATGESDYDEFATLRHLKSMHRDSFVFGYWRGERAFVGASPERLARVDGRDVEVSSLAGTIPRGKTEREDQENARTLAASTKDLKEHAAVRDVLNTELGEECESVNAPEQPSLLTLPHVHHLHTRITGFLREGRTLLDVVARLHPTPAVGGSPRDAALDFIRANEGLERGWYASPVGWIDTRGGEFAVALRSALIDGSSATLYAGCGIVADSDPEQEYAESTLKLQLMESALGASVALNRAELTSVAERAT